MLKKRFYTYDPPRLHYYMSVQCSIVCYNILVLFMVISSLVLVSSFQ